MPRDSQRYRKHIGGIPLGDEVIEGVGSIFDHVVQHRNDFGRFTVHLHHQVEGVQDVGSTGLIYLATVGIDCQDNRIFKRWHDMALSGVMGKWANKATDAKTRPMPHDDDG